MKAADARRHADAQARHEATRARQYEEDRPRPTHEMWELRRLAERAKTDPAAMLDWSVACTPQTFLMALAAEAWDNTHPTYACIHCHDGADLPKGYVCQVCDADNPDY